MEYVLSNFNFRFVRSQPIIGYTDLTVTAHGSRNNGPGPQIFEKVNLIVTIVWTEISIMDRMKARNPTSRTLDRS